MFRFCLALGLLGGVFCFGAFFGDYAAGLQPHAFDPRVPHLEAENIDLRVRLDQARRADRLVPTGDEPAEHLIPPQRLPVIGGNDE